MIIRVTGGLIPVGQHLVTIMRKRGWRQVDLANNMKVSTATANRLLCVVDVCELDKIRLETVRKLVSFAQSVDFKGEDVEDK